ncbi:T9SS type A sorting domain-containing protein [Xanthomarina gelatinilytica]|uniref:T9SS type A sorting domain-containing protein n=1 Tax=Xanthomarina gelatinilytica TaxID=1137281 RepID=UPI003AA98C6D
MKETPLILILIFTSLIAHSQIKSNSQGNQQEYDYLTNTYGNKEKELKYRLLPDLTLKGGFNIDCETDFLSTNNEGEIQQWSLGNGTISGGDVILIGGGSSLGCSQYQNTETFFGSQSETHIQYYDFGTGWTEIAAPTYLYNNGGGGSNQYYIAEAATEIYYFDGQNFTSIEVLTSGEIFTVADIAVDPLGRAWVFVGESILSTESLRVYDESGFIGSYDISFNSLNCAGSMFLDGTLYIGMGETGSYPYSIVPVLLDGGTADLGEPVFFPQNIHLYDLANCNGNILQINEAERMNFHIYPNPTKDKFHVSSDLPIQKLEIYNFQGKLLLESNYTAEIDLSSYSTGIYYLRIFSDENIYVQKVIKD